ncbi:hypothetical protein [Streptomyces sp. NPDC046976]|uniref:hypothetical protein n=1 Tax=Streptomyces sp. NPDC046976 TaxID=3155258 RepID=UPI0034080F46
MHPPRESNPGNHEARNTQMPGTTAPQRARRSRKPTGLASPPIILLAGPDKTGRSTQAAKGTASELIGMTYWIQIGGNNDTADYYGKAEGVRYEIVEHNGSHDDICDAIRWASAQPPHNDKRNMLVIDDGSALWDLHSDEVARVSQARAERRAQASGRRHARLEDPYADEDRDLWVKAKERWGEVMWLLRQHPGPVVMVAREEIVTAYENDHPTRYTTRRLRAERNLTSSVDAVVEFHAVGDAYVTGLHTMEYAIEVGRQYPFAGIDHLLRMLGYENSAKTRQGIESQPAAYLQNQQQTPRQFRPEQHAPQRPNLTGAAVNQMVTQALRTENPEAALLRLRARWGIGVLRTVTVASWWGEISADELITKSLEQARTLAARKRRGTGHGSPPPTPTSVPQQSQNELRSHHPHEDENAVPEAPTVTAAPTPEAEFEEPSAEEEAAPPPPDSEQDGPPAEAPEDVSEAEEPQAVPSPPRGTPRRRVDRRMEIARRGLMAEAEIQARLRFVTVGEHLGPISEEGDPGLMVIKEHIVKHRPALIRQLIAEGQRELAEAYRTAAVPDVSLPKLFAPYFESAPAKQ